MVPDEITESTSLLLLSIRDPDVPVEFTSGHAYFNPLLKRDHNQVFLCNGERELFSLFTGKPASKISKGEVLLNRGWFDLPPRNLETGDIAVEVWALIDRTPQLTGLITQVVRSKMGFNVPAGLEFLSREDWLTWFTAQQMPLPLQIKNAFLRLPMGSSVLSEETRHLLLTGVEMEKQFQLRISWGQIKTMKVLIEQRQAFESNEWTMQVPESLLSSGQEAILELATKTFGSTWTELHTSPVGIETKNTGEETTEMTEGLIAWFRPDDQNAFAPLIFNEALSDSRRPKTVNDYFREAMSQIPR